MTSWPSHPSVAAVLDPVGSVMNGILRDAWVSRHHAFRVVMTRLD
jgi:hypothetical protein